MHRFISRFVAAGALLLATTAQAQVVISQVYGGGGNSGATYRSDFVELHNNGTTTVNLTGWSVQYASSTGTTWSRTNLSGSIAPGGYYLIKEADGAGGTVALPTPDAIGTIAMSSTTGKMALVSNQTALTGSCPLGGAVIDFVGFGTGANCSETAPTASLSNPLGALRRANGCTDTDNNSADFTIAAPTPRNTASPVQTCGPTLPILTISDASAPEGNGPGTSFSGTLFASLSAPAGPGGVSFTATATAGTATAGFASDPNADFIPQTWGGVIPEGQTAIGFVVPVFGDTRVEPDETFIVTISDVTGAILGDGTGIGTIQNDDVAITSIAEIQGTGLNSPMTGAIVTTEGIVTARKFNNGFFLQSVNDDGDASTSDGIFVFTSSAPPASAAVGNLVRVTGTVAEFTPSTNPNQLSITELVSVTSIQVVSTGNALPAPIELTAADFAAGASPANAEKYEGMRVRIGSARVVAGADGNISESSANATTTGVFQVVLADVARPFREAGLDVLDRFPIPSGKNPPRFDHNAERLMVRSRGQIGASSLAVDVDAQIADMTGVMDYFSGTWALLPDVGSGTVSGGKTATAVADARYEDVTIGGFNLLRFFDEVNDSNGATTLTAAALDKRLTKASLAICDYLKAPDILGVVEVEHLRVLGLLADRINSTCPRAPQYMAHLIQGNDVGGINVGFLVSNRAAGYLDRHRVQVLEVTQYGKNTLLTNPNGSTSLLNDRPPLLLRVLVHQDNGASYPVTVIVNHLRSLNGVDDTTAGSNGWATEGDRVRAKRAQQAVFLADLVHQRQQANPGERIVLLGDFNAFEFSDGYVDVMGIVRGDEAAEDQVVAYADSPITRPLIDGSELIVDPSERYSYVFDGNAQTLDHVVVNEPVIMDALDIVVDHARINADFGVHHYGTAGTPLRISDHDPVRIAITVPEFRSADLSVVFESEDQYVRVGEPVTLVATVANAGPNAAQFASFALAFAGLVEPTIAAPAGWTCAAPQQDDNHTTIACTTPALAAGEVASFSVTVVPHVSVSAGPMPIQAATTSQTTDPANANNSDFYTLIVIAETDLSIDWSGGPTVPFRSGTISHFTLTATNAGPDAAWQPRISILGDAPLANVTVTAPEGWVCSTNEGFQVHCEYQGQILAVGASAVFDVAILAPPRDDDGLTLTADVYPFNGQDWNSDNNTAIRHERIVGAPHDTPADPKPAPTPPGRNR